MNNKIILKAYWADSAILSVIVVSMASCMSIFIPSLNLPSWHEWIILIIGLTLGCLFITAIIRTNK